MTLDELANELRADSDEKAVQDLAEYIEEWKGDNRNAEALERMVERFFGNAWISKEAEHSKAYRLWSSFKNDAIHGIGGMTMNERLYTFGLFERFDSCKSEEERLEVYGKVQAKP